MTAAIEPRFRAENALALGVEEELILVDAVTHALAHRRSRSSTRIAVDSADGTRTPTPTRPSSSSPRPIVANAVEGVAALAALRGRCAPPAAS